MRVSGLPSLVAAAVLVAGCAGPQVGYQIERVRGAEGRGSAFTQGLTEEYRRIAVFEADEMYDWRDAGHFARKGLRAAAGEAVEPEALESRDLPRDRMDELASARAELTRLLAETARDKAAQDAALAQGRFDCWVEQQEENFQPDHIAACREAFFAALERVRAAMAPPPPKAEPQPAPPAEPMAAPKPFVLFFAFDSAEITAPGLEVIEAALATARKLGVGDFSITGHADRSGPEDYNLALSLRRANAVRDALVERGIAPGQISLAGRGEAEPAVATADGVREPANRRVEIVVLQ